MSRFLQQVQQEVERARKLYPTSSHLTLALVKEAGEVVKAALNLHQGKGTKQELEKEIIQCAAMCMRLYIEGDPTLPASVDQQAGTKPPKALWPVTEVWPGISRIYTQDSFHPHTNEKGWERLEITSDPGYWPVHVRLLDRLKDEGWELWMHSSTLGKSGSRAILIRPLAQHITPQQTVTENT